MENSNLTPQPQAPVIPSNHPKIVILRWGHRVQRDVRLTTHVALTARALCASGFILADTTDSHIEETVTKIRQAWGGDFHFEMGTPWKRAVRDWKAQGGIIVHLTAYGENIQTSNVMSRIKAVGKDVMLLVGSQKVPGEFYSRKSPTSTSASATNPTPNAQRWPYSWTATLKAKNSANPSTTPKSPSSPRNGVKKSKPARPPK